MASRRATEILSGVLTGTGDPTELPMRLLSECARAVPVTGVGLALMTDKGPAGAIAATDGPALELEELPFTLGEGPCVDASRTGRPVLPPDMAVTAPLRWPAFAGGALRVGVRALFALPLQVGAIRLGVLDLYRDSPGLLGDAELIEALAFSDAATLLLLHLQAGSSATAPQGDLLPLLDHRAEVHQATGIVSVHAGVGLVEALLLLRARAYAEHRSLDELAHHVLSGLVDFRDDATGTEGGWA